MKGHAYLQHFPIFVIPATLAKAVKRIVEEMLNMTGGIMSDLLFTGVSAGGKTFRFAVIGAKGDLKWHSLVCHLTRGYESKGRVRDIPCCHICLAGSPGIPAEHLSESPIWESSMYSSRPWSLQRPPALNAVPFDQGKPEHLYKSDIFHNLRLGMFRDFIASTIFLILRWGYWGAARTVDTKLESAYGHFRLWVSATKHFASLRSFSTALFQYDSTKSYPWANVKGSDATILMKWIKALVVGMINSNEVDGDKTQVLHVILSVARLGVAWFDLIYSHGVWLDAGCAGTLYEKGFAFCRGYAWLAGYSYDNQQCLFSLKPKYHFMMHTLLEIKRALDSNSAVLSPVIFDCQRNEDLIGRISRLSRRIDNRVVTKRVLELYLLKAGLLLKKQQTGVEA